MFEEERSMKLTTYLNFGGNCKQALQFYEKNLGAKIASMSAFGQMPPGIPAPPSPPEWKDNIMHARITIAGTEIMASDAPPDRFQPMRSAYLAISLDANQEAERIYGVLSEGGEIFMKMEETFFAHRFAMLRDQFGVNWMIINEKAMQG
jgi:PhnB protein